MNFMMSLFVSQERLFLLRFIYDLTFFLIVIVIIFQNLIFGVIIDTFADLRAEKNRKEEQLKNDCFICGEHDYITSTCIECHQMQRVEMDDWPVFMEPSCDTLFMCFKEGIAGGGISDVLRKTARPCENGEGKGETYRERRL